MQNEHPTNRFIAWASAPVISTEEEEDERAMDRDIVEADLYGRETQREMLEEEWDEHVLSRNLLDEVRKMPAAERFAFDTAESRRPSPVTNHHLNMFVRWAKTYPYIEKEDYLKHAAQRLVSYWDERLQLFGSDRAYQTLFDNESMSETIEQSMDPDKEALETCGHRVLSKRDEHGRILLFIDSSRADESQTFNRDSMNRACWYVAHSAVANHEHHKDGAKNDVVILYSNENANISDRKMIRRYCLSLSYTLPLHVKAFHFCLCNTHYTMQTLPALKFVLGPHIRKRMVLHFDSTKSGSCRSCSRLQTLAKNLSDYGIRPSMLPHELRAQPSQRRIQAEVDLEAVATQMVPVQESKIMLPAAEPKVGSTDDPKMVIPEAIHTTVRTARRISQTARRNSAVVHEAAKMMQSSSRLDNLLSNVVQKQLQKGKRFFAELLPSCTRLEVEGVVVDTEQEFLSQSQSGKGTKEADKDANSKNQLLHAFIQRARLKEEQTCTEEQVMKLEATIRHKRASRRTLVAARSA